ncbi:MAG: S41 family peptidase [Phycisphaeraceae bacterium]|nr:S41 family peptidase [Phycisphaeraceae bacterium]
MPHRPRRFSLPLVVLAGLLLSPLAGVRAAETPPVKSDNPFAWFDPIIETHRLIQDRFVKQPDMAALQRDAIDAMIEGLGDPYTVFVPNESLTEFNKSLRGEYVGIGASVRTVDGWMTIASPLEDSPAIQAGLLAGDRVLAIDSVTTEGEDLQDSIDRLTGEPGTVVTVTIGRGDRRFDVDITRRHITPRTVEGFTRVGDGWDFLVDPVRRIGYIRVTQFNAPTSEEFRAAIDALRATGSIGGLIIDLRFNPGGLFPAAIEIADLFLDSGVIVSTRGRVGEDETVYAVSEGTLPDFPVAVMVNRQSASASEIVTAALQGNHRAIVVGERSFGKGSVQNVVALPSGVGQIKITERQYFGPGDKVIHRTDDSSEWGVDPDPGFFSPMTNEQYNDMIRVRNERSVIGGEAPAPAPTEAGALVEFCRDALLDPQLSVAVDAVEKRIETGGWLATGELAGDGAAMEVVELQRIRSVRDRLLRELDRVDRRVAAIEGAVSDEDAESIELIPESETIEGGSVQVYDADGKLVSTLRITGEGLRQWLDGAPVERVEPSGG